MVTTIDGKTVTGDRGEPVHDLGSATDHEIMRRIQNHAEAVMIGASSQRSSKGITYPPHLTRIVATKTGNLHYDSRFFHDCPEKVIILAPTDASLQDRPSGVRTFQRWGGAVEWNAAMALLRNEAGIQRLLVEGGSELNGALLRLNLVDELFITIAPKVRLGEGLPTYAGGQPLARNEMQNYTLISVQPIGSELFARYRRDWGDARE